jgi:hypothetical protein
MVKLRFFHLGFSAFLHTQVVHYYPRFCVEAVDVQIGWREFLSCPLTQHHGLVDPSSKHKNSFMLSTMLTWGRKI